MSYPNHHSSHYSQLSYTQTIYTFMLSFWSLKTFKYATSAKLPQSDEIINYLQRDGHAGPPASVLNLKQEEIKYFYKFK